MSRESTVIPAALREQLVRPPNSDAASAAMALFIAMGDETAFEQAVALYCAGARARQEPVESVLAVLGELNAELERPRHGEKPLLRPSRMHTLIFAGILRAFYGDAAVERELGAMDQRKVDAPQHTKSGTWPKPLPDRRKKPD